MHWRHFTHLHRQSPVDTPNLPSRRPNFILMNWWFIFRLFMGQHSQTLWRAGGKISFDKEANAEIYGPETTAQQILGAPASTHRPPEALRPLCALTLTPLRQAPCCQLRCKASPRVPQRASLGVVHRAGSSAHGSSEITLCCMLSKRTTSPTAWSAGALVPRRGSQFVSAPPCGRAAAGRRRPVCAARMQVCGAGGGGGRGRQRRAALWGLPLQLAPADRGRAAHFPEQVQSAGLRHFKGAAWPTPPGSSGCNAGTFPLRNSMLKS